MAERLRDLGLTAMADAFLDLRNQSEAEDLLREDGSVCWSTARSPRATTSGWDDD